MNRITKSIIAGTALLLLITGAILIDVLAPAYLDNYLVFIVGGVLCALAISTTVDTYQCTQRVSATLVSFGFEQFKAHITSSPVFTYQYQGQTYTASCAECLSQRYVLKHYKEGESYTIYLSPKNPTWIKSQRKIRIFDVVLCLIGCAMMTLSVISVFLIE